MRDIYFKEYGLDLQISDTVVYKARNLITTQVGVLQYAPNFGIDLEMFLNPDVKINLTTFKAYCIQQMGLFAINVVDLIQTDAQFSSSLDFVINDLIKGQLTI